MSAQQGSGPSFKAALGHASLLLAGFFVLLLLLGFLASRAEGSVRLEHERIMESTLAEHSGSPDPMERVSEELEERGFQTDLSPGRITVTTPDSQTYRVIQDSDDGLTLLTLERTLE